MRIWGSLLYDRYMCEHDTCVKKVCKDCKESKWSCEFSTKKGSTNLCRSCYLESRRKYNRDRDPRARRVASLRQAGCDITLIEYIVLEKKQNGLCAICNKPPTGEKQLGVLHLDHNHETGRHRELLCQSCNHLLGNAKEDVDILRSAIEYLERHSVGA